MRYHPDKQYHRKSFRRTTPFWYDQEVVYQDVIKETGFTAINNIGELRLALDRLKVLGDILPPNVTVLYSDSSTISKQIKLCQYW